MIQRYWSNYAANSYNFITSVNWVKLRLYSLTYDFSDVLKGQKVIKAISATAVGTNLFTWTNYKGMDPEVSAAGGTEVRVLPVLLSGSACSSKLHIRSKHYILINEK